jgi:glutamate-1-semialdehyde 2,1-aminomutase
MVGVTAEDRAHLIQFDYNDATSLEAAVAQAGEDLAAIILTSFRHDIQRDQELPTKAFLAAARAACDRTGAILIQDDVRAAFRLDIRGSWAPYGIKPDLAAYSKSIANGWPLACIAGNARALEGANKVFTTGSFWYGAAAMAAAVATVRILRSTDALAQIEAMGTRFRQGLDQAAATHGYRLRQTGPVQMPMVLFEGDKELALGNAFCAAALRHGIYLHPRHNMFFCSAHQASDIDRAIDAADRAFGDIKKAGFAQQ